MEELDVRMRQFFERGKTHGVKLSTGEYKIREGEVQGSDHRHHRILSDNPSG